MYLKILAWCVFSLVGDFGNEKSPKISQCLVSLPFPGDRGRGDAVSLGHRLAGVSCPSNARSTGSSAAAGFLLLHASGSPRHLERECWLAPCSQQHGVEVPGRRALPSRAALGVSCSGGAAVASGVMKRCRSPSCPSAQCLGTQSSPTSRGGWLPAEPAWPSSCHQRCCSTFCEVRT